jgi:hypothetical protein
LNNDDVRILSAHDDSCLNGIDVDLSIRYEVRWDPESGRPGVDSNLNNPYLSYLLKQRTGAFVPYTNDSFVTGQDPRDPNLYRPSTLNSNLMGDEKCARDHKWRLVDDVIARKECDCINFFNVLIAVYRLWKCGGGTFDLLGVAGTQPPPLGKFTGGRDYWFPRKHWGKNMRQCQFSSCKRADGTIKCGEDINGPGKWGGVAYNMTHGAIPFDRLRIAISDSNARLRDLTLYGDLSSNSTQGIELQFTWLSRRTFKDYNSLKKAARDEYTAELTDLQSNNPSRTAMDPYIFDLFRATQVIEEYSTLLEDMIWVEQGYDSLGNPSLVPGRSDMCECERLMKCPNGTTSAVGSIAWTDCIAQGVDIIRRVPVVPSWYNDSTPALAGWLQNTTDFGELGGASPFQETNGKITGELTFKIGTIALKAWDVAVVTLDFRALARNMTYGSHYRLAVYVDCKPCPARYQCNYQNKAAGGNVLAPTCNLPAGPTLKVQQSKFLDCLKRYKMTSCLDNKGNYIDCVNDAQNVYVSFEEPDLYKCQQIPFFCDETFFPKYQWDIAYEADKVTPVANSTLQSQRKFTIDPNWLPIGVSEDSFTPPLGVPISDVDLVNPTSETPGVWAYMPSCCACEPHYMPYYFASDAENPAPGYPDNKHGFVELQLTALDDTQLTVVVELLHGQFYTAFDSLVPDKGDVFVHRPTRASYTPSNPSRSAFVSILMATDMVKLVMPLNLPIQPYRRPGEATGFSRATLDYRMEVQVLIGRTSNVYDADPLYETRYKQHKLDVYRQLLSSGTNVSESFTEFAAVPDTEKDSKNTYPVRDYFSDVYRQLIWWTTDTKNAWGSNPVVDGAWETFDTGFLGLPYLPFFSNCKTSDSHLVLSKALEEDNWCDLIQYDNTIAVDWNIASGKTIPSSDSCNRSTPAYLEERTWLNQGPTTWLGPYNGAIFECVFEEQIDIPLLLPKWFEAAPGTVLFYITTDPKNETDYAPQWTAAGYPNANNPNWPSGGAPGFDSSGKSMYGQRTYTQWPGMSSHLSGILQTYDTIEVTVGGSTDGTELGSYVGVTPRQVSLWLSYYQVNQGTKKLVTASLDYATDFLCHTFTNNGLQQQALEQNYQIFQCETDVTGAIATADYQLELLWVSMKYLPLLNAFQLPLIIYIIIYFVLGLLTIGVASGVWGINRLLTRLRHPPNFHFQELIFNMCQPLGIGFGLSCGVMWGFVTFAFNWFTPGPVDGVLGNAGSMCAPTDALLRYVPSPPTTNMCLELVPIWNDAPGDNGVAFAPTEQNPAILAGRQTMARITLGFWCIFAVARMIHPNYKPEDTKTDVQRAELASKRAKGEYIEAAEDDELDEEETFQPYIWRRTTFYFVACFVQVCLMIQMMFSYSSLFGGPAINIFIIMVPFIYMFFQFLFIEPLLREQMACLGNYSAISIISSMTTMGASNFVSFVVSYIQGMFLTYFDRMYQNPFIAQIMSLTPMWIMQFKRYLRGNKRMTRDEKAKEELEWRRINEEIELESEGIEPLLGAYADYTGDAITLFMQGVIYYQLDTFYFLDSIANNYNIGKNQTLFYYSFAFFIVPFALVGDVFTQNTQELIWGWKVNDYLAYQKYRFSVREHRWMLRNQVVDESISQGNQNVDLLCFSSQFYFICCLFCMAQMQINLGLIAITNTGWNPFGDPISIAFFFIMFVLGEGFIVVAKIASNIKIRRFGWRGLWVTKQIEGTVDDDVAAKLAIGEGRQADLEQERLELQALNSERFRHRFLERNRPWILQHLVELLTPRSLDEPGPDGRPAIEYVRDVYAELMAMGEGMKRAGDAKDMSDDDVDELEAARRNWPRNPLTGASLAIARMWLAKARKRRTFAKLVRGIIDQNKKNVCELCARTPSKNNVKLTCLLAHRGRPDITAIDRLISGFETQYSINELDPLLWKAFFRANAEYVTRCSVCDDAMAQEIMLQQSRAPGASRITRGQDISSDEDEDHVDFEPVVVTRTSPEGLMMSKWLLAARKTLGGEFPRADAKRQMERYAQKLRQLKMKNARDSVTVDVPPAADGTPMQTEFNAATKALALRWVRLARDGLDARFRTRSETLRVDLDNTLSNMPEEDDWYFGASLRLEGKDLDKRGKNMDDDRKTLEAEAAVKIYKIENDLVQHLKEREDELVRERRLFDSKLVQQGDRITLDIDLRLEELTKLRETKMKEFKQVEKKAAEEQGAAPTEMKQNHRNQILAIEELMSTERERMEKFRESEAEEAEIMFSRAEKIKRGEMERRKAIAGDNVARIRLEVSRKIRNRELEWQGRCIFFSLLKLPLFTPHSPPLTRSP